MKKKYIVELSESQVEHLQSLIQKGKSGARVIRRAHVLLLAREGKKDREIASIARCSTATVQGIRQTFSEKGLEKALQEKPRSGRPEKLQGKAKAHLIALACSDPPEGQALWTLRLLANRCVSLDLVEDISHETVRKILKKMK
jgi:transposase